MAAEALEAVQRAVAEPHATDLRSLQSALKTVRDLCTGNPRWKAKVAKSGMQDLLLRLCAPEFAAVHEVVVVLLVLLPDDHVCTAATMSADLSVVFPVIEEFFGRPSSKHVELALRTVLRCHGCVQVEQNGQILRFLCQQIYAPISARALQLAVKLVGRLATQPDMLARMCELYTAETGAELVNAMLKAVDGAPEVETTSTVLEVLYQTFSERLRPRELVASSGEAQAHIERLQRLMYNSNHDVAVLAAVCLCCHPATLQVLARPLFGERDDELGDESKEWESRRAFSGVRPEPPLKYARTKQATRRDPRVYPPEMLRQLHNTVRNRAIPRITTRLAQHAEANALLEDWCCSKRALTCLLAVSDVDSGCLQSCAEYGAVSMLQSILKSLRQTIGERPKIVPGSAAMDLLESSLRLLARISAAESATRMLLDCEAIQNIQWTMQFGVGVSKHASIVLRDISRSTAVSSGQFMNTSLLHPVNDALGMLLASVQTADAEHIHALCVCVANACVHSTAAKRYAVTGGLIDKLLQLMEQRRVDGMAEIVLKSLRNIAFGGPADVKSQILASIGSQRSTHLLRTSDGIIQQLVFALLRVCLVGLSKESARQLFDTAKGDRAWHLLLLQGLNHLQVCDERETILHVMTVIACLISFLPECGEHADLRARVTAAISCFRENSDPGLRLHAISCLQLLSQAEVD